MISEMNLLNTKSIQNARNVKALIEKALTSMPNEIHGSLRAAIDPGAYMEKIFSVAMTIRNVSIGVAGPENVVNVRRKIRKNVPYSTGKIILIALEAPQKRMCVYKGIRLQSLHLRHSSKEHPNSI